MTELRNTAKFQNWVRIPLGEPGTAQTPDAHAIYEERKAPEN